MYKTKLLLIAVWFAAVIPLHAQPPTPAVQDALDNFPAWDADADGTLTRAEIDQAIASPTVTGRAAAAAVALRRVSQNRQAPVESFTPESVREIAAAKRFVDARDEEEQPGISRRDTRSNYERYHAAALRRIENSPRLLFVGPPRVEGLIQGRVGSCFSLAAMGSVVKSAPEDFQSRLTQNPEDGTLTMRFGEGLRITVSALTDGEIALGTTVADGALWAAAYEKTVGELRRRSAPAGDWRKEATPFAVVTRGGSAGTMLSVLTGREIRRFTCRHWLPASTTSPEERTRLLDELRGLLRQTFEEGRLATAGTSTRTRKVPSLSQNHAYSVIEYDASTDLVLIRDPHGQNFTPKGPAGLEHGYEVRDGFFRVPVPEVVELMAGFAFQVAEPREPVGYGAAAETSPETL